MGEASFRELSISDRADLVSEHRDQLIEDCAANGLRLTQYRKTKERYEIYFECLNEGTKFVIMHRIHDLFHWNSGTESLGDMSIFPMDKKYWNWCDLTTCPDDPAELFFVDPGG
jgi:hypothetical protein